MSAENMTSKILQCDIARPTGAPGRDRSQMLAKWTKPSLDAEEDLDVDAFLEGLRDPSPDRPSLWEAIQKFRAETDLDELDIDSVMEGVRDRSPGRDIHL